VLCVLFIFADRNDVILTKVYPGDAVGAEVVQLTECRL
jgi:hypothetical protein